MRVRTRGAARPVIRAVARRALPATLLLGGLAVAGPVAAQRPVTLEEALRAALATSPRLDVARADSSAARAQVRIATAFPNPDLALDYSKSVPQYHAVLEEAIDYPWLRGPRIRAARAGARAASLRADLERALVRFDVARAYAVAAAARRVAALSGQGAADGEELVRVTSARRDAGDASDLDVDLARVNAAQLRSAFLSDSLQAVGSALRLQSLMGLSVDSVAVAAVDTLPASINGVLGVPGAAAAASAAASPASRVPAGGLAVAAGEAERAAAAGRLTEARRARLPLPALRAGFEMGDPSGGEPGILPTFGVSVPIPLFNRGGGEVDAAKAEAARADASLARARRDAALAISQARHEQSLAAARLEEDRAALVSARRVARLSLSAYREGAYPLASVLEAQRSAREAERQVLDDVAALSTANAALALARLGGVMP